MKFISKTLPCASLQGPNLYFHPNSTVRHLLQFKVKFLKTNDIDESKKGLCWNGSIKMVV
jgi:hypothetical protein